MKNLLLLFISIGLLSCSDLKDLKTTVNSYKLTIEEQNIRIKVLESQVNGLYLIIGNLKNTSNTETKTNQNNNTTNEVRTDNISKVHQCSAITLSGSQCSRNAQPNSDFCWQHIKSANSTQANSPTSTSTTNENKTIITGSRGGQYYINSKGNKTYIKRK
jgi:hypothetical protein